MKNFLVIFLFIPFLLFSTEWNMENLIGTLQGCANDEKEFFDVLSNGEILEYCACTTKMTANLLTENDIIELYEKNQLADKMSELNEKHQINKICTEKLFK